MEGRQSTSERATKKCELIIAAWNDLGRAAIGEAALEQIQSSLREVFGPLAELGPAAIARILADEGAELLHPEVIECDARWREARIERETNRFKGLDALVSNKPLRLKQAELLINKLETLRKDFEKSADQTASRQLRSIAIEAREAAELVAWDRSVDEGLRREQAEIAQWIAVWLQTPNLFADWFDLRRRSTEFRKKFLT